MYLTEGFRLRYQASEQGYMGRKVGLEPTTREGDEPSCSDHLSYLRWLINNLTNLKT